MMPAPYGNSSGMLQETISKITYKSEYKSSFTGESVPIKNFRIPTAVKMKTCKARDAVKKNETSRSIQFPLTMKSLKYSPRINLQALQPFPTTKAKSALEKQSRKLSQLSLSSARPLTSLLSESPRRDRPSTEDLLRRPQSLVARRPRSELSRFPKDFRYIDKQCFFHPANELTRRFFVISPDWVSERKNYFIRKNTLFG
ncbi:uncharacterized protein [Montipora capricornis]|uniref:uncharacterized protein n=1 Tax=Montipora capricornis TaxID=246305 RepID=UPI0035F116FF